MQLNQLFRPRTLAAIFLGYVLVVAVTAALFASGPGSFYAYTPDVTLWALGIFLILAVALFAVVALVATGSLRHINALISQAEMRAAAAHEARLEEAEGTGGELYEDLPAPLPEGATELDQAEQDIDQLLAALGAMETSIAGEEGVSVVQMEKPEPPAPTAGAKGRVEVGASTARLLERLQKRRAAIAAFFVWPALLDIAIIGIAAIALPGAAVFLLANNVLNTTLLLGLAYSFPGIALYTGLSVYGILTNP